ncbi:DUF4271 domain-containing protein [Urechidicola croceus]|uniref:DUF4271 domain-containing protein n=1 Tax=Urechidicola croceus TaxID=1850246 RepID=A0A1D8P8X1_9FLAO|nr:hypothetical protein LPB138_10205 [Urechidicola croceus]
MNYLSLNLLLQNDWITFVFLIIFILLGVVKFIFKDRLNDLILLFVSKKYFLNFGKEKKPVISRFNFILFIVQTLVLTLLFFSYLEFYQPKLLLNNNFELFVQIFVGLIIFFAIRYVIGFVLGRLFEVNQLHEEITFAKVSYLFSISIIILPLVLFVFFMKNYNLFIFQLTLLVLLILLIFRYLFIFRNNKKRVISKLFYFILYLCALEIAPMLLIFKLIL